MNHDLILSALFILSQSFRLEGTKDKSDQMALSFSFRSGARAARTSPAIPR